MIRSITCFTLALIVGAGLSFAEEPKPGVDLSDRDLTRADYSKAKLPNVNLERSVIEFASFADCTMPGANLRKAHFRGASFARANLVGADLTGADARNAGFGDADLSKAILDNANLEGVSFHAAKLIGASLKNAKVISSITRTDFTNADLCGADLSQATDYGPNSAIFKGARYDLRTKFPVGVDPASVGAVFVKGDPRAPKLAKDNLGTPLRFYKALLYYTPKVTKAEALKLGDFMEQELNFGTEPQKVQLDKAGKVYQIRMETPFRKEEEVTDEIIAQHEAMADKLAKSLYSASTIEIHFCDDNFKTVKVVKLASPGAETRPATPTPDLKPETTPEPKPGPTAKPEARTEPAVTEFGTELKFRKARLYYTKNVSKDEAAKLGKFLVDQLNFGRTPLKFQLNKTGSTVELRMAVKPGRENDADFINDCKELGKLAAKNVFPSDPVEIHLCDEELKTLKVIKPE